MKRLFGVSKRADGKPLKDTPWFDNKMKAKAVRDENKDARVVLGPDHRRYVEVK